ncbi:MAG: hypothetical protein Q9177_005255 [Variospora cf. flavescens]
MSNMFHYFQVKRESYTGADPQQRGCPVATVAINNSVNAAQLAVRILATDNARVDGRKRLEQHLADQTKSVLEDSDKMERLGFEAFCSQGLDSGSNSVGNEFMTLLKERATIAAQRLAH